MRDAWSCPLPNEIFEVGSQGPGEDIAGLGVAIALALASYFPSRTRRRGMRAKSQTPSLYASRRIDSLRRPLGRAGSLPYSMR